MPTKPKGQNKFAAALKAPKEPTQEVAPSVAIEDAVVESGERGSRRVQSVRPSRKNTKHVGGYYDPAVSKQLRAIALEEDSSVQALIAEGIDLLFQSRRKPTIAQKPSAV